MARKKREYGFLTTRSNMVDVVASNPQQAYRLAKKKNVVLEKKFEELVKQGKMNEDTLSGTVTTSYVTFGRYGFVPVGAYKQVRFKSKLKKVI